MNSQTEQTLLRGVKIVKAGDQYAGPVAAARLAELGATATKIEPPSGDPLKTGACSWYDLLIRRQTAVTLNLKDPAGHCIWISCLAARTCFLRPSVVRLCAAWDGTGFFQPTYISIAHLAAMLQTRWPIVSNQFV